MSLEFYLRKYLVVEICNQFFGSVTDFGEGNFKNFSEMKHGPYVSRSNARRKISSMVEKKLREGWKKFNPESNDIIKGDRFICYDVKEKFVKYK